MSANNGLHELDNEMLPVRMVGEAAMAAVGRGESIQQVRASYATAVTCQVPRQLDLVRRRIEDEGRLAGEEFYYGWGAGKDRIEGPSVKLANALARCWGNCAIEMLPVQETRDAWIFTAVFVDLETGFTLPRQFRQSKTWTVYGKMDEARKEDIRFQIGQSKAIRNVVLNALPASLVERAMIAAKSGVREKLQAYIQKNSLSAAQDLLIGELAKLGVKEEAVLRRQRVAERKALDVEALVVLRGDIHAIQEGQARPDELFPSAESEEKTGSTADALAAKLASNRTSKPAENNTAPEPSPKQPESPVPHSNPEPATQPAKPAAKDDRRRAGLIRALKTQIREQNIPEGRIASTMAKLGIIGEASDEPTDMIIPRLSESQADALINEFAKG